MCLPLSSCQELMQNPPTLEKERFCARSEVLPSPRFSRGTGVTETFKSTIVAEQHHRPPQPSDDQKNMFMFVFDCGLTLGNKVTPVVKMKFNISATSARVSSGIEREIISACVNTSLLSYLLPHDEDDDDDGQVQCL
ncbi:hypothetical protein DPX16_6401 [Anabarilius grahami]|uniref:Uncharacterized protein n=1 Tax=Anabarilius grahami TaxID=495550 RepID=A0A3N0YMV8_ANAGA|nr:hypothetical protein DPX16_6401 [Anabarilius grahami]